EPVIKEDEYESSSENSNGGNGASGVPVIGGCPGTPSSTTVSAGGDIVPSLLEPSKPNSSTKENKQSLHQSPSMPPVLIREMDEMSLRVQEGGHPATMTKSATGTTLAPMGRERHTPHAPTTPTQ
ncbi:hypothetical protein PMAYCL1PPCAC_27277, partial [Pristionchus mayeri]